MADRRIITKIAYDTGELVEGAEKVKLALKSVDDAGKKQQQTTSSLEREYRRLVGAIDPADKAQQKYARAVDVTNRLVEKGRITQEQANETLRKAETFYSAQAASIRNVGDLFDKLGGKSAILAGKIFAVAESFKFGWQMGEELREKLNELMPGFDAAAQKAWGFSAAARAMAGSMTDAADAAAEYTSNLEILRRLGIDTQGMTPAQAAQRMTQAQRAQMEHRGTERRAAELIPDEGKLLREAEAIRLAWEKVKDSSEAAQLNIARRAKQIKEEFLKVPREALPPFIAGLASIVDKHEADKKAAEDAAAAAKRSMRERAAETKRAADEMAKAWERAHEEAIEAEARATEEAKRLAAERLKILAEGMAQAHEIAADRARDAWIKALDDIEAGVAPIRRALQELGGLDQELEFSRRSSAAAGLPTDRLRSIEQQYLTFMRNIGEGSVEAGESAFKALSQIIGVTVDDIKAKLGELADLDAIAGIRGAGKTPQQVRAEEMAELQRLRGVAIEQAIRTGEDILAMERDFSARELQLRREAEEEILATINAHISAWGNLFDFLGDRFGGLFQDIARGINTIQSAQGAGSQIGGLFGAAGAGGMAGLVVGFALAAYDYVESQAARRRARRYETTAIVGMNEGSDWTRYFTAAEGAMRRASAQIRDTIEAFAEAIGGVFTAFETIEIRVRRDGEYFRAFVGGILVGTFKDMETAVEAAILEAFKDPETLLRGVSDLVRQGFNEAVSEGLHDIGLEELQDFLADLREISEIRWDSGARQMQQMLRRYDELWDSLLEITEGSAAQAQGAMDLALSELDAWRARIRGFTGEPESRAEQEERMLREGRLIEAQLAMRIADLKLRQSELRIEMEMLRSRGELVRAGGGLRGREIEIEASYVKARAEMMKVEVDLYQAHLDAIAAALEAIGLLIAELERLAADFNPEDFKLPRVGGGGRQQAREWLADNAFRLAAERMGDVERQLAEMNRMYDEQAEGLKAGSEEMRRLNAQRREEAALIRQRGIEAGYAGLRGYEMDANPFAAERERAGALKTAFDDLLKSGAIGQERYERAMNRVNVALERHLDLIGQQESAALFGGLAGLLDAAGLGDSAEKAALIAQQQKANFALQLAESRLRYEMLVAEGVLIGKNKELVEGVLRTLEGFNLDDLFSGGGAGEGDAAAAARARSQAWGEMLDAQQRERDEARKLLDRYAAEREDPLVRRLRQIETDFNAIFAALGRGQENLDAFRAAIDNAFDELTKPVEDWLASLGLSEQSPLTQQQQLELAASQYDALLARINAGDTSAYGELAGAGQQLLDLAAAQYGTAGSAYQDIYNKVIAMGQQAVTLADAMAATFFETGEISTGTVTAITLSTASIVDAIAAGTQSTQESARELATIKEITAGQAYSISTMAVDMQALRAANQSMLSELIMIRNSRPA